MMDSCLTGKRHQVIPRERQKSIVKLRYKAWPLLLYLLETVLTCPFLGDQPTIHEHYTFQG